MIYPRASLTRAAASIAVAVLVLSLVLVGGGSAAAQTTKPYGPATQEELDALERAQQNVGAPENPIGEGRYPEGAPEAAQVASPEAMDPWSGNWATGRLCGGAETCLTGDFNGDGKDDALALYGETRPEPQRGDAMVAISTGMGFSAATKWADLICIGSQVCKVGDVNNDGKDDLVIFNKGFGTGPGVGNVFVALSTGSAFGAATLWQPYFCIGNEVCDVGNVDGLPGADLVLFMRSAYTGDLAGDVYVARSNGVSQFMASQKWHDFFCLNDEECRVADMDGDGRADIAAFVRTGSGAGRVPVALSNGYSFGTASDWSTTFCGPTDQCMLGNFNGNLDGSYKADAVKFAQVPLGVPTYGDVNVSLSTGSSLAGQTRWHDNFCYPGDDCSTGDFNGDGRTDIIRFVKQSANPALVGAAYVAFAAGTPATGFVPTPQATGGKWSSTPCANGQSCASGDFNGDGLDDIVYFTRDAQSGGVPGSVFVSLNQDANQFAPPQLWLNAGCFGTDTCKVGDVNNDGKDDLIIFSRLQTGAVFVSKSTGTAFEPYVLWNPYFCVGAEVCEVGDFNGDHLTDIALFTRSTYGNNERAGDVEVAINTGNQFVNTGLWHTFFCIGAESCQTGDVNGDGRSDIISFSKGSNAKVFVELSTGTGFGDRAAPAEEWQSFFCAGNEYCATGDVNGDGKVDILAFLQSNYPLNPSTRGAVYVGLSTGSQAAGGFISQRWGDNFCLGANVCGTGYFNRDARADIFDMTRGLTGTTSVALSALGSGFFFSDAIQIPADAKKLYLPLIAKQ